MYNTYYYNVKKLKKNDFSDLLNNWKGHWIILSAIFEKITSEDKETEVCAGIVPEKNEDVYSLHESQYRYTMVTSLMSKKMKRGR